MEAKLMSDCGKQYIVDATEGDRYQVDITSSDYIVVAMGFTFNKAAANSSHASSLNPKLRKNSALCRPSRCVVESR